MKHLIFLIFLAINLLSLPIAAQADEIQAVIERDPFDPDRGKKEEVLIEEAPPEEAPAIELPVLDGTMIFGSTKIAVLSFEKDGMNLTARVEMLPENQGYQLYLREKKKPAARKAGHLSASLRRDIPARRKNNSRPGANLLKGKLEEAIEEEEESGPKFPLDGERNGKIAGYKIVEIANDYVMLAGAEAPFKLEMFREGAKEGRGGSKQNAPSIPKPQTQRGEPKTGGLTKVEANPANPDGKEEKAEAKNNTQKPAFNRRKAPVKSERANTLKKRF